MCAGLPSTATIAVIVAGMTVAALAPAKAADEHHPYTILAQAAPGYQSGGTAGQGQGVQQPSQPGMMGQGQGMQPGQPGMMGQGEDMQSGQPGMMGHGMMGRGRRGGMGPGMMRMGGHMMKVMFAIADVNGDGALSFEEVMAVHRRIFNAIDANKDGLVTPEEFQAFMRD